MKNRTSTRFLICLFCFCIVLVPISVFGQAQTPEPAPKTEADGLIQTAFALFNSGKYEEALANCAKASTLNKDDFRPHLLSGMVYMAQMKMKSASEAFARVILLKPEKEYYVLKAMADVQRSATDEALAACKKALEIDPNYGEAYALIGESLKHDEKRRTEAVEAYQKALKLNPGLIPLYESLGEIFLETKDQKKAEEYFRQGITSDPKHQSGRFRLGRLLVEQGRLAEARELWEGRTSDEDNTRPTFIDLLTRAENLKRATDALAKKPDDPDALIDMGIAVMDGESWVVDGRQERAIVYFKKALALKPNYAKAEYQIVKAMIQYADTFEKNNKKVDQELAKLRKLDPALAKEMEDYRKTYQGGLVGTPVKTDQ